MSGVDAMESNRLQLQSSAPDKAGDLGFKLIGQSKEDPSRLVRIWVRRKKGSGRHVWHRLLEPEATSRTWEFRVHLKRGTGAMTLIEASLGDLDEIAQNYSFPQHPASRAALASLEVTDPLFGKVRDWALSVTGGADASEAS